MDNKHSTTVGEHIEQMAREGEVAPRGLNTWNDLSENTWNEVDRKEVTWNGESR